MPPLLTIEPWELPPDCDVPLTAPADFVFRSLWQARTCENLGSERKFAKPRKTEIWARRIQYKDTLLFFICDSENLGDGNWHLSGFNSEQPSETWDSTYLAKNLKNPMFWYINARRYIYFDAAQYGFIGAHYLIMFPGAVPYNYNVNKYSTSMGWDWENVVPFLTPWQVPDLAAPLQIQKAQMLSLFGDKDSEAYLALSWLHATHEERRAKIITFQRGNVQEMQKLLRAALIMQTDQWTQHSTLRWETRDWWEERAYKGTKEDHLWSGSDFPPSYVHPISPRLTQWKKLIWNYFRPTLRSDLFMLGMDYSIQRADVTTVSVEVSKPTNSDYTETSRLLNQWWDQEFTPFIFDIMPKD